MHAYWDHRGAEGGIKRKRPTRAANHRRALERSARRSRIGGSIAFAMKAADQGVQVIRVYEVLETVQALQAWRGMYDPALIPKF